MACSVDVVRAEALARKAHQGAVDKAGAPYIEHPARVAGRLASPVEKVVAWLHDVVEDTPVTLEEIERDFGPDTARSVDAVTHRKDEPWSDYLIRVKKDPVARAVKVADLIDNSNLSRFSVILARDVRRQAKYNRALYFLMDIDGN